MEENDGMSPFRSPSPAEDMRFSAFAFSTLSREYQMLEPGDDGYEYDELDQAEALLEAGGRHRKKKKMKRRSGDKRKKKRVDDDPDTAEDPDDTVIEIDRWHIPKDSEQPCELRKSKYVDDMAEEGEIEDENTRVYEPLSMYKPLATRSTKTPGEITEGKSVSAETELLCKPSHKPSSIWRPKPQNNPTTTVTGGKALMDEGDATCLTQPCEALQTMATSDADFMQFFVSYDIDEQVPDPKKVTKAKIKVAEQKALDMKYSRAKQVSIRQEKNQIKKERQDALKRYKLQNSDKSDAQPIPWNTGEMHEISQCSQFIRITARGVHFPAYNNRKNWRFRNSKVAPKGWGNITDCFPTADALCEEVNLHSKSMLYFPTGVVDLPDDLQSLQPSHQVPYVQNIMHRNKTCINSASGREIKSSDTRYELSLCDLIDNKLDIVYDRHSSSLMYRFDETSLLVYIVISVIGIYLVSSLAENIRVIISADTETSHKIQRSLFYNFMLTVALLFVVVDAASEATTKFLLFDYEITLYYILVVFILTEFIWYVFGVMMDLYNSTEQDSKSQSNGTVRCVSMLTATLLLLTARIHYTFDNPYSWILATIFGVRSAHKMINRMTMPTLSMDFGNDNQADNEKQVGDEKSADNKKSILKLFNSILVVFSSLGFLTILKLFLHLFDAVTFLAILTYGVAPCYNYHPAAESATFLILSISILAATVIGHHADNSLA